MSEQADEADSKSVGSDTVWVRFPLSALLHGYMRYSEKGRC